VIAQSNTKLTKSRYDTGHPLKQRKSIRLVNNPQLIHYLKQDLGLSEAALALVTRQHQPTVTELPIALWNHGLIDLDQVERVFDWIERTN
jgi:hypothetical protein